MQSKVPTVVWPASTMSSEDPPMPLHGCTQTGWIEVRGIEETELSFMF